MAPRSVEQFEHIREERKRQIMDVALALIAKEGFGNVSIAKIAQKAKISKGLMYNYFSSKEELISEIMYTGLEEMVEVFDPNKDGFLTQEEMHFFIGNLFRILENNIEFYRMYFMVMFQPDVFKLIEPTIRQIFAPFTSTAVKYFERKNCEDPIAETWLLIALLDGIGVHFVLNPTTFPLDRVKKIMHRLYD